jgi:hypothetical protein
MLQEGLLEALEKKEVAIRVVDKLTDDKATYNGCTVEEGVLYIEVRSITVPAKTDSLDPPKLLGDQLRRCLLQAAGHSVGAKAGASRLRRMVMNCLI